MTSEARQRALAEDRTEDPAVLAAEADRDRDEADRADADRDDAGRDDADREPGGVADDAEQQEPGPHRRRGPRRRRRAGATAAEDATEEDPADAVDGAGADDGAEDDDGAGARRRRGRLSVPLIPVLAVLLVLLLGALGWLWFTRPAASSVHTGDYVEVLQAARSEVVDLTSFDYLTLDDDIAEAKRITTGDLQKETIDQFNSSRQQLGDSQAVVQTEVVGAAVTRADSEHGTVLLVIQSTQKTSADEQAQVVRYRIEAELTKVDGRWVLSGLTGR